MCGIAGIVAYRTSGPPVELGELTRVQRAMTSRGPDGTGQWTSPDGQAALAHLRLAIIDPSDAGAQPMASACGRLQITFNGEIYNYPSLRAELISRGHRFRSTSDTEVLLHLYLERGAAMVEALRGMYAFAIRDDRDKTLFLARDPFGIKPLYYADDGHTIRFASQVKALLAGGGVGREPEPAGHVGFFVLGSVPEPFTLFREIKPLPAGHTLTVRRDAQPRLERFFDVAAEFANGARTELDPSERAALLREALCDSVRHHMVSDVPVGLFLSAGLDSTTIAALACETGGSRLHSLTLGFGEFQGTENDEVPLADTAARTLGTIHTTRRVTRVEFEAERDKILAAMDQPSIDGVNTYFVSKAAAECGMKVALSGLGGDELFGGYPSFGQVPRMKSLLGFMRHLGSSGRIARRVCAPLLKRFASPKYAGLLEYGATYPGAYLLRRALYMPWELRGFMDEEVVREGWEKLDLLARMERDIASLDKARPIVSTLEMSWYMRNQLLRDADWAGMAHSLEIRVPLVDVALLRTVASQAASSRPFTKGDMAATPRTPLPREIRARRKTGFGVPTREWIGARDAREDRGNAYRVWARRLNPVAPQGRRVSVLVTDAFGGRGGIAKFNRDLLRAIASHPETQRVVAFPRLAPDPIGPLPANLAFVKDASGGKVRYALEVLRFHLASPRCDLVVCGHLNLLPLAWLASVLSRSPLVLVLHGIEAWKRPGGSLKSLLVGRVDRFVAVSALTRDRFAQWSRIDRVKGTVLPNSVDLAAFTMRPRNTELAKRLGIENKTVIMTMGRLASTERYKGLDEVMEAMPALARDIPELVYLVVGDGDDRARLQSKAHELGIGDRVRFAGFVAETEKSDYYGLADAFVMPGSGEGFGIVYLEAMASGLPVLGSTLDGSQEALRGGALGILVDPRDPREVVRGIGEVLKRPRRVPEGLQYFDFANFQVRCHRIIEEVYAK